MKKTLAIILVAALVLSCAFASDFKVYVSELATHPFILYGFCPTFGGVGLRYNGLHFMKDNTTQLQASVAGGYIQRQVFRNSYTGEQDSAYTNYFDVTQLHFTAQLSQGFGDSWVPGKDLVTAYIGYDGTLEMYHDSLALLPGGGGLPKKTDYKAWMGGAEKGKPVSLDSYLGGDRASQTVYPELSGDSNYTSILVAGATLNCMEDKMVSNEGVLVDFKFQFSPKAFNKRVGFYSAELNAVAGTTIYEKQKENGLNLFSIVLLDRANVSWIDGKAVPVLATTPLSLGRKVRGFDKNSFTTTFTFVNNLDIRFASPEPIWDGVFVRLNLFLDFGCYAGRYVNTGVNNLSAVKDKGYLASTGAQLTLCFMDVIDLGIQYSYLLHGKSISNPSKSSVIKAIFFLDF